MLSGGGTDEKQRGGLIAPFMNGGITMKINIENAFFNEEGIWHCEGTIGGIYFNGHLKDGRYFEWGTEKKVNFPPHVLKELIDKLHRVYSEMTIPEEEFYGGIKG
jgi:hypothetical protein